MPIDKTLSVRIVEDFEEKVPWIIKNNKAIEVNQRFVPKNPLSKDLRYYAGKKERELWERELSILKDSSDIHKTKGLPLQQFSHELQFYISSPGYDKLTLEIPDAVKARFYDRPVAVSLWVYGTNKQHSLYLLASSSNRKSVPVRVCTLDFEGWKRIEVPVPGYLQTRNRYNNNQYEFQIDGIQLISSSHEDRGHFLFVMDLMTILLEVDQNRENGAWGISDKWE